MKQMISAAAVLIVSLMAPGLNAATVREIKTVYLLPMTGGLDQFLAVQLTTDSVLQVVTDPQKADAVFTDHLGDSFEQTLADLYAPKSAGKDKADDTRQFATAGMQGQKGRGTAFLVDRKSHEVIWSNYEQLKDKSPDGMKRTADHIASKLARAIKGK